MEPIKNQFGEVNTGRNYVICDFCGDEFRGYGYRLEGVFLCDRCGEEYMAQELREFDGAES